MFIVEVSDMFFGAIYCLKINIMKRIIVDYRNLTLDILKLLKNKYPEGYTNMDIIVFTNHKKETIKAIEVTTNDIDYLVKISRQLSLSIENFKELNITIDYTVN